MPPKKKQRNHARPSAQGIASAQERKTFTGLRGHLPALVALCAVTLVTYGNSFRGGFVFDNRPLILEDPRVHEATSGNIAATFEHTYNWPLAEHGLYRPITTLTYLFNYAILGNRDRPAGYHCFNFLLHLTNVFLVYFLIVAISSREAIAGFAAAIWAVHPAGTEAVTNIIGRSDLLAAAAVLGGLLLYIRSTRSAGWRRMMWLIGLGLITFAGMFSKESAIAIVAVIPLYQLNWWERKRGFRDALYGMLAIAPGIAAMLVQRSMVLANSTAPEFHYLDNPLRGASFLAGRLTAVKILWKYVWMFLWPARLSSNYSFNQIPVSKADVPGSMLAVGMMGLIAVWVILRKKIPAPFFFAGFAFVCILPAANLFFLTGTIMAERLRYLPSVGLAAIFSVTLFWIAERSKSRWIAPAILCAIILPLGVRTRARNRDWRDDMSFWAAAVKSSPNSAESHRGLAQTLYDADRTHANLADVIAEADTAVRIVQGVPDRLNSTAIFTDAGKYHREEGDRLATGESAADPANSAGRHEYEASLQLLLRGVGIDHAVNQEYIEQENARGRPASEIAPQGFPQVYEHLAVTHIRLGQGDNAIEAAQYARRLAPLSPETHSTLAWVFMNSKRPADAATALVSEYLLTGDTDVVPQLQAIYRAGLDREGCASINSAQGASLNPSCRIVHAELCQASSDIAGIFEWNRRPDLADNARSRAINSFGCGAEELRKP
ncbi:MAG TPA: hypothetical protein VFO34_08715 [Candidatus Acidoferrales bacterium]|nr:hypothetical protein [Candidatus Acidoferrales bacterium]